MKTFACIVVLMSLAAGISAMQPPVSPMQNQPSAGTKTVEAYYPPPESAGGWRPLHNPEEVRKLAGMDPFRLDVVGEQNVQGWGHDWAIVVIRRGYLVREWFGTPAMRDTTFDVWSCTKSVTSMAYGLLFEDSRNHRLPKDAQIDLDSPAYAFMPEAYPLTDPRKEKIKLRHLLSMTSGIPGEDRGITGLAVTPEGGEFEIALGKQANRFGHSTAQLYAAPGEGWDYSDAGFAQLSLIFFHVTGRELADYMKERVFLPVGMENFSWDWEGGSGNIGPHTNAHSGFHVSARDFARLGYLMLHGGAWKGNQIVPKWWVDLATHSSQDVNRGYGYGIWANTDGTLFPGLPKDTFAFRGFGSNRCYVIPSLDLVVVRVGVGPSPGGPIEAPLRGVVGAIVE
jgi:CubicO group peptidase (beta-lactamase class C family)